MSLYPCHRNKISLLCHLLILSYQNHDSHRKGGTPDTVWRLNLLSCISHTEILICCPLAWTLCRLNACCFCTRTSGPEHLLCAEPIILLGLQTSAPTNKCQYNSNGSFASHLRQAPLYPSKGLSKDLQHNKRNLLVPLQQRVLRSAVVFLNSNEPFVVNSEVDILAQTINESAKKVYFIGLSNGAGEA